MASDGPGFWLAGAGVVLTLGVGVLGALPDVCRRVIMTPAPTASTASAVPTATTTGRRYQASATAAVDARSGGDAALACGRAEVSAALLASSGYSPARIGMMPESSPASDQANAGAGLGSAVISEIVVASATDPAAVGANAVALSAGPRAARSAAPTAAVRCGRGAVMTGTPNSADKVRGDHRDTGSPAHRRDRRQVCRTNSIALQHVVQKADEAIQRLADRVVEFVPG